MDVTPDQNVQENQPPAKRGKGGQPSPKKSRVEETPVDESQAYVGDFVDYGPGVVEESTQTSDRSQSARTAATAATSTALSTVTSYTVDEFMARFQEQSVTKNVSFRKLCLLICRFNVTILSGISIDNGRAEKWIVQSECIGHHVGQVPDR